jgi:3-deoxy-7-phosphoheptulonate synthase
MGFEFVKKIPTTEEIIEQYPSSEDMKEVKAQRDREISEILTGTSDKFLLIIGPCSADHPDPVLDYVGRLAAVQQKVADKLLIIPRIYTNKPRTTGEGYRE